MVAQTGMCSAEQSRLVGWLVPVPVPIQDQRARALEIECTGRPERYIKNAEGLCSIVDALMRRLISLRLVEVTIHTLAKQEQTIPNPNDKLSVAVPVQVGVRTMKTQCSNAASLAQQKQTKSERRKKEKKKKKKKKKTKMQEKAKHNLLGSRDGSQSLQCLLVKRVAVKPRVGLASVGTDCGNVATAMRCLVLVAHCCRSRSEEFRRTVDVG